MADGVTKASVFKDLNVLVDLGASGRLRDDQLLDRFVEGRGLTAEAAFRVLVDRHGPMVLGLCRQVLGNSHDAQDAFQATFLILASKAGSVRKRDSLASWLHGVARRVAQRIKAHEVRRRCHEHRWTLQVAESTDEEVHSESWPELHEEIAKLPARYRESVVLCYLQGLTTEVAAERLGCPRGTVLSRLSRAREELRRRLTRRGVSLPACLFAVGILDETALAMARVGLLETTVQASLTFANRRAVGSTSASGRIVELAKEVLYAMAKFKLGIVGTVTLAGLFVVGVVQTLAYQSNGVGDQARPAVSESRSDGPGAIQGRDTNGASRSATTGKSQAPRQSPLGFTSFRVKEGHVRSVAYSPDGKTLAVGYPGLGVGNGGGVLLWDVAGVRR